MVKAARGGEEPIEITWQPFSLQQVNQKVGPDYLAWSETDEELHHSVWGLRAGEAARLQGEDALRRFMPLILEARHVDRKELNDKELLKSLAAKAGLDVPRFEKDLGDRSLLDVIAASHTHAVEDLGVFGTPTFVFENGAAAFLKMLKPRTQEEAVRSFDALMPVMEGEVAVGELKRPQPPWPKGIFDRT